MTVMNFDLEDGKPPVSFNLKLEDCERFMEFMAECQSVKDQPQRTWVGLTDEDLERIKLLTFEKEINADGEEQEAVNLDQLIRAAEQLCKEKNRG